MPNPLLTPDEREAKLPGWVRDELTALRIALRDAEKTVAALKGEHPGSNVTLLGKHNLPDIPLPSGSWVAFASNWGRIRVGHDLKGLVNIQGDSQVLIHPVAGNNLSVELKDN